MTSTSSSPLSDDATRLAVLWGRGSRFGNASVAWGLSKCCGGLGYLVLVYFERMPVFAVFLSNFGCRPLLILLSKLQFFQ
jgi:hypothetical protein